MEVDFSTYFYEHQPMEVLILDEVVDITIKDKKIVGWTMIIKEKLIKLNLGGGKKTLKGIN
jgi:hypothetical protein